MQNEMSIKDLLSIIEKNGLLKSMPQLEMVFQIALESEHKLAESEAKCVQLAAENVALKSGVAEEIEVINRGGQMYCVKDGMSINPIYARGWNDHRAHVTAVQTPATDIFISSLSSEISK